MKNFANYDFNNFNYFSDYDYYWYQDEDGNWRNEYDDYGYVFDPDRYEGDEEDTSKNASKDASKSGTVIPSSKQDDLDKQMVPPPTDHLSTPSPGKIINIRLAQKTKKTPKSMSKQH